MKNSDIVIRAFNEIVAPIIRLKMTESMVSTYGLTWWKDRAEAIMVDYSFHNKIVIKDENNPLQGFDTTALFFLLFPFEQGTESQTLEGLSVVFQSFYHLTDNQMGKLRTLRTLRNLASHAGADDQQDVRSILGAIANAIKPIDEQVTKKLEPIFNELKNREISHENKMSEQTLLIRKVTRSAFVCEESPIAEPIFQEIPWENPAKTKLIFPDVNKLLAEAKAKEAAIKAKEIENSNATQQAPLKSSDNKGGVMKKIFGKLFG